ncbi:MAG: hypothetical protein ACE5KE_09340 [Methanosarcinales archaeon]
MADVAWAYYKGLEDLLKGNSGGYLEMGLYYFGVGLIFYNRYISDLDLFTDINLGILASEAKRRPCEARLMKQSLDCEIVYLIPFTPNIKKIGTVILCILIIAPIATTAYKEEKKINHENEINYSELSAYLFLKGKNGTLFTDYKHASWAYAITKINTSTLAFSKNRDIALRIYFGSEDNNRVFEKPYYLVYNEGILSRYKKIFDNGGTEVRVL